MFPLFGAGICVPRERLTFVLLNALMKELLTGIDRLSVSMKIIIIIIIIIIALQHELANGEQVNGVHG